MAFFTKLMKKFKLGKDSEEEKEEEKLEDFQADSS